MSQVVAQATEEPKTSSRDRTLQCTAEQIPNVPVPEMVTQLVQVPETVSRDGVQQRTVEQIVDAPVLQAVEELAEVSKVFSQDGIQQRAMEQTTPATSLVDMIDLRGACRSDAREGATGCEHACSARRQYSRSGEAPNHQADMAETPHPGEDQPGDEAR